MYVVRRTSSALTLMVVWSAVALRSAGNVGGGQGIPTTVERS